MTAMYDFLIIVISNFYVLLTLAVLLFWYCCTSSFDHWKKQGIKYKTPVPFFGNTLPFAFQLSTYHENLHELYMFFRNDPIGGFFQMRDPYLLVKDPELVNRILVTDFSNFVDRKINLFNPENKKLNPLSGHLFFARGERWRAFRRKMSPIFTSGKLKGMHGQVHDCVEKLHNLLEQDVKNGGGSTNLNLKAVFDRLTIDTIGSTAFGIECNSLQKNDEFREMGNKALAPNLLSMIRNLVGVFSKKLLHILQIPDMPNETKDFFMSLALNNIHQRRDNNVSKTDLFQLLMDLQNAHNDSRYAVPNQKENVLGNERFDEIHIAANSFLFFIAGYETTASTLAFCLYELAINEDVQEKLRHEVESVYEKHDHKFNYENLNDMQYMNAVISETLRKYPVLPWLMRSTENDHKIFETEKVIRKGTTVVIPAWSIQNDPKYYPNPQAFRPERFLGDNAKKIGHGTYMPFGDGPRNCIGSRFAKMEIRLALAEVILKYDFKTCSRTRIPLNFAKGGVLLTPDDGVWVNMTKRIPNTQNFT